MAKVLSRGPARFHPKTHRSCEGWVKVEAGASLEHTERLTLHRNVKVGNWTDAELDRVVLPLVGR